MNACQREKMRLPVRIFMLLVTLGVVMPGLVLLVWSNGKTQTMTRTVDGLEIDGNNPPNQMESMLRSQWYESHENVQADIFKEEKSWSEEIPEPILKEPPKEPSGVLPEEPSRSPSRDRRIPSFLETPKPLPKEPPRPKSQRIPDEAPRESNKDSSRQTANGNPQKLTQHQWWKNHMRKACQSLNMAGSPLSLTQPMLMKILVDDKHKLIYCTIPKVASTTWRRVFLQLTGKLNHTNYLTITANDVHHKYDEHLTYLGDLTDVEIAQRLRDYFKFTFVREPFERILSAYNNKFVANTLSSSYFKWNFGRKIIQKYRKLRSQVPKNNTGSGLTFEEFVDYLVDDRRRIVMNEHWELYHKLCHPCLIDYDYIGHLERIDEDSKYVLDLNHLSDRAKVMSRKDPKYNITKTNTLMPEAYAKLPPKTIARLYEMYKADFMIFNYTVPEEISKLMSPLRKVK